MLLAVGAAFAHAAGSISVQANATWLDANNQPLTLASNVVTANIDDQPPTIAFYTDATYSHTASAAALAKTLYIGVDAQGCNRQPGVVETMVVDIWSQKLQETLHVTATESGPDTGIFQFRLVTGANSGSFQSLATTTSTSTVMPLVPASPTTSSRRRSTAAAAAPSARRS